MPYETVDLEMEVEVTVSDLYLPLTGIWASDPVGGWVWDRRRSTSRDDLKSKYETYLGGHTVGLLDGTRLSWWQSGTVAGLTYGGMSYYPMGDYLTWTPRVHTGAYSLYYDERILYSDYSHSEVFDSADNQNGASRIVLRDDAVWSTISVTLFERDENFLNFKKHSYKFVEEFTGEISGGTRLDTNTGAGIIWGNVETRKREFLIEDGEVLLNQDGSFEIGPVPVGATADELADLAEYKGYGVPQGRSVYLNAWPVEEGSVTLYVVTGSTIDEWTETATLNLSEPTDEHYQVDYDLGIIQIGGYQAPDLVLYADITNAATELECFPDPDSHGSYPDYGVIVIGSEKIYYGEKTRHGFSQLTRGYDGTGAAPHTRGDTVSDQQHGLGTLTNQKIYVAYKAMPRIEYETTDYHCRTANQYPVVNIAPAQNAQANAILQISSSELHVSSITLETDSPLIGADLYGPVYFGTDVSKLTATVYDSAGNPVDGIEVNVEIYIGPGKLNGEPAPFEAITNSLGQIYVLYTAPYDTESVFHEVTGVTNDGTDTTFTVSDLSGSVMTDEITVFQILKHDKILGTVGRKTTIDTCSGPTVTLLDQIGEEYVGGYLQVTGTDAVVYTREITSIFDEVVGGLTVSTLHYATNLVAAAVEGQPVYLFEREAEEWDPTTLNGVKVVLYEWSTEAIHPITEAEGAYTPLRPDTVAENELVFESRLLAEPDPLDPDVNLGGYVVVAPVIAQVYAWARDPATGRLITSNTIKLYVTVPAFLNGVDTSGALPIPYGFTLVTEEFNIGSGIGGANFLTINPRASGVNTFSIFAEVS